MGIQRITRPYFLEFCGHYIKPVACKVKRPKTKGKVERPFYPLEQHFIKGREFESFEEFIKVFSQKGVLIPTHTILEKKELITLPLTQKGNFFPNHTHVDLSFSLIIFILFFIFHSSRLLK